MVWPVALAMAVGQFIGGYLGAMTGIRFGARLIRPVRGAGEPTLTVLLRAPR